MVALLQAHVQRFDEAVGSGDFTALVAGFAPESAADPGRAGRMIVTAREGSIVRLVVTFE